MGLGFEPGTPDQSTLNGAPQFLDYLSPLIFWSLGLEPWRLLRNFSFEAVNWTIGVIGLDYYICWLPLCPMVHRNNDAHYCEELFSRRRWRLVSAQVVSCCVYETRKNKDSAWRSITNLFDKWADTSLHLFPVSCGIKKDFIVSSLEEGSLSAKMSFKFTFIVLVVVESCSLSFPHYSTLLPRHSPQLLCKYFSNKGIEWAVAVALWSERLCVWQHRRPIAPILSLAIAIEALH